MYGDDFDVTRDNLLSFPFDIDSLDSKNKGKLIDLANELQSKIDLLEEDKKQLESALSIQKQSGKEMLNKI